jgi:hypothetical protein
MPLLLRFQSTCREGCVKNEYHDIIVFFSEKRSYGLRLVSDTVKKWLEYSKDHWYETMEFRLNSFNLNAYWSRILKGKKKNSPYEKYFVLSGRGKLILKKVYIILFSYVNSISRDSAVDIATGYGMDDRGV